MNQHLTNLARRAPALEPCLPLVGLAFATFFQAFSSDRKPLPCGSGGSAFDTEHWAGELLKGFVHKRPLSPALAQGLPPELARNLQWTLPTIPLTGFPALTGVGGETLRQLVDVCVAVPATETFSFRSAACPSTIVSASCWKTHGGRTNRLSDSVCSADWIARVNSLKTWWLASGKLDRKSE